MYKLVGPATIYANYPVLHDIYELLGPSTTIRLCIPVDGRVVSYTIFNAMIGLSHNQFLNKTIRLYTLIIDTSHRCVHEIVIWRTICACHMW